MSRRDFIEPVDPSEKRLLSCMLIVPDVSAPISIEIIKAPEERLQI